MNNNINNLIKYSLITEKTIYLSKKYFKYSFIVDRSLNKKDIKNLFEKLFDTNIIKINTCLLPIKKKQKNQIIGFKANYKKVIFNFNSEKLISYFI
jgi:large subunit ribosomal protein L23